MSKRQSPGGAGWAPTIGWRLFQLLTAAGLILVGWRLLRHVPYRIDIDVYRMGGRAWLDNQQLYADGAIFHTQGGLDLPFTYPPLAAIMFAPFAWLSLPAASVAITATTLLLLIVSMVIVLTRLNVWPDTAITSEPAWLRRCWLAAALVAPAVIWLEPIRSNFEFGQINVVLMTLVVADCVPRRTPWPRGVLLGLAIALKLTPAVFLLYFLLRRDIHTLLRTAAATVVATLAGFVLAWTDSIEYWTETVRNTDRIGTATLNTNQNIAGTLARLGLSEGPRFALWVVASFAVLALTVWAAQRALRAGSDESPVVALICVAMFGLVVSPVSWSHHWVWSLPTLVVTGVLAYRMRKDRPAALFLALVTVIGFALMVWTPIDLLTPHHETAASVLRQLAGDAYLWWALVVIAVIGFVSPSRAGQTTAVPAAPLVKLSGGEAA
ncbi:alpha-(1-2)-phosphatidylinositol mannosyltransferase [Mycolicibacterium fortuitum]|uniref:glycosyltransferase 87 family protein n=1 Tax=Mycolicibacterium fortuitum TaxID=1766 RepID=UPI0007EC99A1|nr:glycosyltransferase 87 family protein [Mycolicibacterium fortuitum]OBJ94396.1 alpha-(1-2)-phosphatidylinositol mannosyltransferase [Mycolicibacterium fortuitum]